MNQTGATWNHVGMWMGRLESSRRDLNDVV